MRILLCVVSTIVSVNFLMSCARHKEAPKLNPESSIQFEAIQQKPLEERRAEVFSNAILEMKQASYTSALHTWDQYLTEFSGLAQMEEAQIYRAKCLFYLSKFDAVIEALHPLLESPKNSEIYIDGRLLYAEAMLMKKSYEEAVAITFDLLPNRRLEKKLGIRRTQKPIIITKTQELKVLTLRGRIFGEMNRQDEAVYALRDSRKILKGIKEEKNKYTSIVAWRQLETLSALCRNKIQIESTVSESEFLEYSKKYYHCIEPGRVFYCEVLGYEDPFIRDPALRSYKEMVLYPKIKMEPLPLPARSVKPEYKANYEREMKELIEKTVNEESRSYRNLENCNAHNIF